MNPEQGCVTVSLCTRQISGEQRVRREVERVKGIEPSLSAWEAGVMPLYDTRSERLTLYQMWQRI